MNNHPFSLEEGPSRWTNGIVNFWFTGPDGRRYRLIQNDQDPDNLYSSISYDPKLHYTKGGNIQIAGVPEHLFRFPDILSPECAYKIIGLALTVEAAGIMTGEGLKQQELRKALGI